MQTIMIVEDEKVIRDAIVQELEKWNYEVVAVEDFSQVYTQFLEKFRMKVMSSNCRRMNLSFYVYYLKNKGTLRQEKI